MTDRDRRKRAAYKARMKAQSASGTAVDPSSHPILGLERKVRELTSDVQWLTTAVRLYLQQVYIDRKHLTPGMLASAYDCARRLSKTFGFSQCSSFKEHVATQEFYKLLPEPELYVKEQDKSLQLIAAASDIERAFTEPNRIYEVTQNEET